MNGRAERLQKIARDIERHGQSVTLVSGGPLPRYAYTIGLRDAVGFEIVLAGASYYTAKKVHQVLNALGAALRENPALSVLGMPTIGAFSLRAAHSSWTKALALGALDFYGDGAVPGMQVIPDPDHLTIDVPDMTHDWTLTSEPVWRWLDRPWDFPVSPQSVATTNVVALQGSPITELVRWGEGEWEMFAGAGPEVAPGDVRTVPLATLLGHDPSLLVALEADIGSGYWRATESADWNRWVQRQQ